MNRIIMLWAACMCLTLQVMAQETEGPLPMNPEKAHQYQLERQWPEREARGGGSLSLPFFDDFSRYSLPTSNPDIPLEWQRWEDDNVFLNCTFPLNPPTVGVATFDGLRSDGYPHQFFPQDSQGPADTLTSLPINLSSFSPSDSLYLTFFYQPEGLGNDPDTGDKLYLEFSASGDENDWDPIWEVDGLELQEFEQVFIGIADTSLGQSLDTYYFEPEFRFRFINHATLSGNMDHWHLDYVLLDANNEPDNFEVVELAFMECENTILNNYTAMPWSHFIENPGIHMLQDSVDVRQRNMGSTINFTTGFRVEYENQVWDMENNFSNTSGNGFSEIDTKVPINVTPNNFVFDTTVNDTCAVFDVKFYHSLSDATQQNDTIVYQQVFQNYYAYDDGTAERAYAINEAGGKVAVKYQIAEPDSLIGLFIHFMPFLENQNGENFLIRAWSDAGGIPGDEMGENFSFNTPIYYENGYNKFTYYEYDSPIYVDGLVYVGWVQDSDASLNVGNDKNTNSNPGALFYQLGLGTPWTQSGISGSVMIRPVFQAGKTNVWNEISELEGFEFMLYPNPAEDELKVFPADMSAKYQLSIYSTTGQLVLRQNNLFQESRLDISELPSALYILQFADESGSVLGSERFIKR